jgi:hypothetical protein
MATRSHILVNPSTVNELEKPHGGGDRIRVPGIEEQADRMIDLLDSLKRKLDAEDWGNEGVEPEKALMLTLAEETDYFSKIEAISGSGMELLFDTEVAIPATDVFYPGTAGKTKGEIIRKINKDYIDGRAYGVAITASAWQNIFDFIHKIQLDPALPFSGIFRGFKGPFRRIVTMSWWGYKERFEETGIIDAWVTDLLDDNLKTVKAEIELFYRRSDKARKIWEDDLTSKITKVGGTVNKVLDMKQIAYHAMLVDLPRGVADQIIAKDPTVSLINAEQTKYFRVVGQKLFSPHKEMKLDIQVPHRPEKMAEEPVVALLDGFPQGAHPLLEKRITIDDPDNFAPMCPISDRIHGTSMASIIIFGDLSGKINQLSRVIYARPILKPRQMIVGIEETMPNDLFSVDLIHKAVAEMFVGENGGKAPTVKVINFSVGVKKFHAINEISPMGRILDWLSYKFHVLFIVSAGNNSQSFDVQIPFDEFSALSDLEKNAIIIKAIQANDKDYGLLSPAESINSLTVGATFEDAFNYIQNHNMIFPCSDGMMSPYSSIGPGFQNSIKPDIVYPGGKIKIGRTIRNIQGLSGECRWIASDRGPGILSAFPSKNGISTGFSAGTSNAVALISHEASRCYETLDKLFLEAGIPVPENHIALIIKAMLVHGASWDGFIDKISLVEDHSKRSAISNILQRFVGYGKPDIERVLECTENRITLIGFGDIVHNKAYLYDLPLPFNFFDEGLKKRRLTVTLAYFAPILLDGRGYRCGKVYFDLLNCRKELAYRTDANVNAVKRGTIQHEVLQQDSLLGWEKDEPLHIKLCCRSSDSNANTVFPFALMVTFEIINPLNLTIYDDIRSRINLMTNVPWNSE